jgi:hypothetical protein
VGLLTKRLRTLDEANAGLAASLKTWTERLPRIFLVEVEYQLAMRRAEAGWVRGLLSEIVDGTIGDVDAWRRFVETGEIPADIRELDEQGKRGWPEDQD